MPMRLVEAPVEDDRKQRLTAMQTKLRLLRRKLRPDDLVPLGRRELTKRFGEVAEAVARDVALLPRSFIIGAHNLPAELRRVQRGCVSIVQSLNDREIKRTKAVRLGRIIDRRLRRINIILNQSDGSKLPIVATATVATPEDREEELNAAKSFKGTGVTLKSFSELQQMQETLQEERRKLNMLEQKHAPGVFKPTPAIIEAPIQQYDAGSESRYNQRLSEDAERVKHLLQNVQKLLPKPIKFKKNSLYLLIKSPVLVVTQRFVPDSVLKTAHIKYDRMYQHASLSPGYTPGFGGRNEISLSPVILYNQYLMVVPLHVAMDRVEFNRVLEYNVAALGQDVGGMMPVPIGMDAEVSRQGLQQRRQINQKIDALQPEERGPRLLQEKMDYLRRVREGDHGPLPTVPAEELLNEDAGVVRQIRRRRVQPLRILDTKRRYFTDKHYPGVAFVWLMLHHVYNQMAQVKFISVGLPHYETAPEQVKINKTDEEKAAHERMNKLRQVREDLVGDLTGQLDKLDKYIADKLRQIKNLDAEIEAQETVLSSQQAAVRDIRDVRSPAWRTAQHAMELTLIHVGQLKGELTALETDVLPKVRAQKNEISKAITERLRAAAEQRKSKK